MKIKLNGKVVEARNGETILEVARREGVEIPTLCYLKKDFETSNCRMCLVEVKGQRNLVTACSFKVFDGMEVNTDTKEINSARKMNLELILSNHDYDCKNCSKQNECELERLAKKYKANSNKFKGEKTTFINDTSSPSIVRDNSKCILCKKCVQVCNKLQTVNAIGEINRGFKTQIGCAFNKGLNNTNCVACGQCIMVCPTGALKENDNITEVENLLKTPFVHKVIAPAPVVRVAIQEAYKLKNITEAEKLLVAGLKKLGFDRVFDVNFSADLTVVEEASEFLTRLKTKKNIPMFTSCCPSWVDFVEKFYPKLSPNISTCKSPMLMFGAVAKTYYSEIAKLDNKTIKVVSVMPCTAKKKERLHNGQFEEPDIDIVITVRELIYLFNKHKIDLKKLEPQNFDRILGESSGAGAIFGTSGGVMEAAVRTVADIISGESLSKVDYLPVRGMDGVKLANLNIAGNNINIAVVSGFNNARALIDKIIKNEINLHFVEIMACPGGCINGGGMPYKTDNNKPLLVSSRSEVLYALDKNREYRKSHENPEIKDFFSWQKTAKTKPQLHTH